MSVLCGAAVRRPSLLQRLALLFALLWLPLAATLGMRAVLAGPGAAVMRLDAAQARRADLALELAPFPELPAALLEVRAASGVPGAARSPGYLLAATSDGRAVAMAERIGQDPTTLVIASADGSQLRVPMDGLLAAAYAPDGSWLAVDDGLGRLWRIDAASGEAQLIADGPFAGSLAVEADGSILALAVSSVEAPFVSRLVRLGAADPTPEIISGEALVYAMTPLEDGSLAVVSHRPGGTTVQRIAAGQVMATTDLGSGAVNVSMSSDGNVMAWELDGQVLLRAADAQPVVIASGTAPRVAPNGQLVVLAAPGGGTDVVAADGAPLAHLDGPVALLDCGECGS